MLQKFSLSTKISPVNKTILTIILSFVLLFVSNSIAYAATITMPSTLTADTTSYVLLSTSGTTPSVSGFSTDLKITLSTANGTVRITTTTGLTAPTGYVSGDWAGKNAIAFEGSQININNALATLGYQGSGNATTTLSISATPTGAAYNPTNEHYYELVTSTGSWTTANTAASAKTFNGLTGYLATITTSTESTFVKDKVGTSAVWFGASDAASEGVWKWVTGPENGTQFWSGAASGSAVGGAFTNWDTGEPNNNGSIEHYMYLKVDGTWNDAPDFYGYGYVVEYGGLSGEIATVQNDENLTITSTQNNDPILLSLTPADNSTDVTVNDNMTLTFNEAMDVETGNITIYKTSDNSTVETIDITSGLVTGTGTTKITINPTSDLSYETEYYIFVDATALDDSSSNSYVGISASTTWSFTTEDTPICPAVENASTYNSYPTCGVATCSDEYTLSEGTCIISGGGGFLPPPSIGNGKIDKFIPMYELRSVGEIKLNGNNILMYIESSVEFNVLTSKNPLVRSYTFKILDLNMMTGKIKIEILPKQKIVEINIKDKKYIDLDNDGINDIELTYNKLLINRIDLTIKQLEFSKKACSIKNNDGTLLKDLNHTTVYFTYQNKKCPFFNPEAFLSNKFKWDDIKIVDDLSYMPTEGMIYAILDKEKSMIENNNNNTKVILEAGDNTFENNLSIGMTTSDVRKLQKYLNNNSFELATIGLGSLNHETNFFGKLTESALIKFQKAKNIVPAVGFFGPITRRVINK